MPNLVNKMVVRELSASFKDIDGMLIVSMSGLTVAESEALRTALATRGVPLRMVPNRLARLALKENGHEVPDDVFKGNVAVAVGDAEQAVHAAKVVADSEARKNGKMAVRAGVLEGRWLGGDEAAALASLPDRATLNAKLLGCISGPARKLVGLLVAPQGALARVIKARADQEAGAA